MAETIPGGAYLDTDGKTWRDAEGRQLSAEQVAEARKLQRTRAAELADADAALTEQQARRDPVARALLSQQEERRSAKPAAKSAKADEANA